ncbi:hypothetical protein EYZ11_010401 [Aspergillus tanneri]|uniref:Uncharacterized protein n=1 Tax=Aspergillus tanneri TaxID=1220188 RepID=A0A4V3UN82_9EURO|nr:hypothetical protein EYZ11_010401 [Aspergillus tanneri]
MGPKQFSWNVATIYDAKTDDTPRPLHGNELPQRRSPNWRPGSAGSAAAGIGQGTNSRTRGPNASIFGFTVGHMKYRITT